MVPLGFIFEVDLCSCQTRRDPLHTAADRVARQDHFAKQYKQTIGLVRPPDPTTKKNGSATDATVHLIHILAPYQNDSACRTKLGGVAPMEN